MKKIIKHKYFALVATLLILALPLLLIMVGQNQEIRGRAEASTALYFLPASSNSTPITKNVGDKFYLDIMLNPGNNLVSVIKADIRYDSSLMNLSETNPIIVNDLVFPQILEGPVYSDGRIQIILSVGPNLTNAISTQVRALTVNFTTKSPSRKTAVSFGSNTVINSVSTVDSAEENVLSTATPAYIKINSIKQGGDRKKPR